MTQATSEPRPSWRGSVLALVVAAGGLQFEMWAGGFPRGLLGEALLTWMVISWLATAPLGALVVATRGSWLGVWLMVLGIFYWALLGGGTSN